MADDGARAPAEELSFQAEWADATDPRTRHGVIVGASGVVAWDKTGLGPQSEYGQEFPWSTWWEEGRIPAGAPAGLFERIDAVGRRLGFKPSPPPPAKKGSSPGRRSKGGLPTWSKATRRALGWAPGATPALTQLAEASGLDWVEPIGITDFQCWLGIRRIAGLPLDRCPVVLCHGPNAATIATEARDSFAALLWRLGPRESEAERERILGAWPAIEDEVREQSRGLGGEAAVDRFVQVLEEPFDPGLAAPANDPRHLSAVAGILGRLDPGQAGLRERIAALGTAAEVPDWTPPPAWSAMWAATRYVPRRGDPDLAWAVAGGPPSLDCGARLAVQHFVNVRQDWSQADIHLASKVALRKPREGPLARAVAEMVEVWARKDRYDGLAHLKAAGECAVEGDFDTAAILLMGAGYWSQVHAGRANPVLQDAWAELRRNAGWA